MIHIAIADDHELIRKGLCLLIKQEKHIQVDTEASSFHELVEKLQQQPIDVLILDLNLGDINGLQTIEVIIDHYPDLPILVLSAYPEDLYALRAFKCGASGYLNKSTVSTELVNAIETVALGKKYISQTSQEVLPLGSKLEKEKRNLGELLSKREFEVLNLIADGYTPKEIAQRMKLSPKTISTYRSRMMEKLKLETAIQLQYFAYETFSGTTMTSKLLGKRV